MSITTLEAAIAKLESLKDGATGLPWHAQEYSGHPGDEGVPILGGGAEGSMDAHMCAYALTGEEQATADAEMIVTLSRAVGPLIAMHRRSLLAMKAAIGSGMSEADVNEIAERSGEMSVARAILGEEEHD